MATLENVENQEFDENSVNAPLIRDLAMLGEPVPAVSPDNPPWSSPIAFVVWLASVIAIIVVPAIILLPYIFMNRETRPTDILSDPTAVILNLLAVIPAHLLTLAVCWYIATHYRQYPIGETLGLASGGFRWWHYPLILVGFFGISAVVAYFFPEGDNDMLRMLRTSRSAVVIVAILATVTAPLVEEVVYRGILYSAFQRTMGVPAAVAVVTFFFALVHVPQYWGSPATIMLVCLLSLILTLIRVKSKNLWPCIVMHALFNGIQSIGLLSGVAELK